MKDGEGGNKYVRVEWVDGRNYLKQWFEVSKAFRPHMISKSNQTAIQKAVNIDPPYSKYSLTYFSPSLPSSSKYIFSHILFHQKIVWKMNLASGWLKNDPVEKLDTYELKDTSGQDCHMNRSVEKHLVKKAWISSIDN